MILETIRCTTDALVDPDRGVAAQLPLVPRDAGDPLPVTPTVADETRSFAVAITRPPAILPALTVNLDNVTGLDPQRAQRTRDGQVAVVVRYVDRESNRDEGTRDAYYVMRAVVAAIDAMPLTIARNGIEIYAVTDLQIGGQVRQLGDAWVLLSLRVVFQVRDTLSPVS